MPRDSTIFRSILDSDTFFSKQLLTLFHFVNNIGKQESQILSDFERSETVASSKIYYNFLSERTRIFKNCFLFSKTKNNIHIKHVYDGAC